MAGAFSSGALDIYEVKLVVVEVSIGWGQGDYLTSQIT
jgi:hypothetical protein